MPSDLLAIGTICTKNCLQTPLHLALLSLTVNIRQQEQQIYSKFLRTLIALATALKEGVLPSVIVFFVILSSTPAFQPARPFRFLYTASLSPVNMADPNDLSPREMEVLAFAWQCMDSEPKVCWIASNVLYTHTY